MITDKFPILEFDDESRELIDVRKNINEGQQLPKNCVISFFGNIVKNFVSINHCKRIGSLIMETFELGIYEYATKSQNIAIMHGLGSGPYAAGQIEKLAAMGCEKFIVCGGCGVLEKNSNVGDIYVPVSAVRDEGTSYHYVAPSREIDINPNVEFKICSYLDSQGIAYKKVKTWTTDAMYRETEDMVKRRREEGCHIVEMECASFFAVSQYKQLDIGLILYAGDDLSKKIWDSRNWKNNSSARYNLFLLALEVVNHL